jgi:hypothetical protein
MLSTSLVNSVRVKMPSKGIDLSLTSVFLLVQLVMTWPPNGR